MFGSCAVNVVPLPSGRSHLPLNVPPTPDANGAITTSFGVVLPAWSCAVTVNSCPPSPSPDNTYGLVHVPRSVPSRLQVNDAESTVLKEIDGAVFLVGLAGPAMTGTSGAVVSTVHDVDEVALLPAASNAATDSVCVASDSFAAPKGLVQPADTCCVAVPASSVQV